MKLVIRAVIFSLLCVTIFSLCYKMLGPKHFRSNSTSQIDFIDYLFLATTIQAGVGYSDIYPTTDTAKTILIIQQMIMITTYVFLLYIFTL